MIKYKKDARLGNLNSNFNSLKQKYADKSNPKLKS